VKKKQWGDERNSEEKGCPVHIQKAGQSKNPKREKGRREEREREKGSKCSQEEGFRALYNRKKERSGNRMVAWCVLGGNLPIGPILEKTQKNSENGC